jgi:hypothetical protein
MEGIANNTIPLAGSRLSNKKSSLHDAHGPIKLYFYYFT